MRTPTLSIIIPAYNCHRQIRVLIDSILGQDFTDYEIIVVNDHSDDETTTYLATLPKLDKRIQLLNLPENGGASVARNAGLESARGKYIAFYDADDQLPSDALRQFIAAMQQPDTELVISGFTIRTLRDQQVLASVDVCTDPPSPRHADEPWRLYILRLLGLDGRLYQVWNKLYRADIINQHHLRFPAGINFGEDLLFNLDYYAQMTGQIRFIDQSLYIYNQDQLGGTFSKSSLIYANRQQNFAAVEQFAQSLPTNEIKNSLLHWLKYDWIYSHLLAISSADWSLAQKIAAIHQINAYEKHIPLSSRHIIGTKRYLVERFLQLAVHHPRFGLFSISLSNHLKNGRLTAGLWRQLRRQINH